MKIDYLHIRSKFKNLCDVKIEFDENNLMTVIVGSNGSGKSNVLEALVSIFRNLDLGEAAPFSYELKYKLGEDDGSKWITVDADPTRGPAGKQYEIIATTSNTLGEGKPPIRLPLSKVKRSKEGNAAYLPKFVFAYYSGPSDRLENYFRKHRDMFYRQMLYNEIDLKAAIRPLFYAKPFHSQFVLLAFFLTEHNDEEKDFLREHLGISDLESVHFVMRKPNWAKKKNELFWGASGVVREFLDAIYPHSLAPIKITRQENTSLTGNNIKNEFLHLFLPDATTLRSFAKGLTQDVFFKMLESTLLSEIISEVSVRVKVTSSNDALTFRELSEGEQQLLTVLGLLKFTGGQDSLFLLDEPDTHLNPAWAVKYLSFLRNFVPNHKTSHLLMVTHHPLAIAELEKEQVQVMWRDHLHQTHAKEPEESPRGMGYAGILTSDMFNLKSTLDYPTEQLLRKRKSIIEKDNISEDEKAVLKDLEREIESLGFSTSHWDKEYQEYLRIRRTVEDDIFLEQENVSTDVLQRRKMKAKEIIKNILAKEQQTED